MRKVSSKVFGNSFAVTVIPTLRDNFTYIIHDFNDNVVAAVDVNDDIKPVQRYLENTQISNNNNNNNNAQGTLADYFAGIFTTHKHWDHCGGNEALKSYFTHMYKSKSNTSSSSSSTENKPFFIVGGSAESVPGKTITLHNGETFSLGKLQVTAYDVPCHTRGHVMYKVCNPNQVNDGIAVFTGDTVFVAGLGAFFEGDASDMVRAMTKLYTLNASNNYALDEQTFIFPGHEYTLNFMKFTQKIVSVHKPSNSDYINDQVAKYQELIKVGLPTVPSSLKEEKIQNLFLRVADNHFVQAMKKGNQVQLMDYLYNACD